MKKISFLPSLFTTGNLFCGAYSVVLALNENYLLASWFILISIIFDFFDGQIARLKNMVTKFGVEYDSLSDLVSFGFAPAILVYVTFLKNIGRIGFALFFVYIACTALRLARFNAEKAPQQKMNFTGFPTPASSGLIASIFILNNKYPMSILAYGMPVLLPLLAALMVSTLKYPAYGILNLWKKNPFLNLVAVIICGTMIFLQLELFLFLCFTVYALSGIAGAKWSIFASIGIGKSIGERSEHEIV